MQNPFLLMIDNLASQMFITDKSGKVVFFPWGAKKEGYYINKTIEPSIKKFIKASFLVCFILIIISLPFWKDNLLGIVGTMAICFGGWYFVFYLFVSRIVKSLQPTKANYTELIFERYETEELNGHELEEQNQTEFPAQWNEPLPQANRDPFLGVKIFWFSLMPVQHFTLLFFFGCGIFAVYVNNINHRMGERPIDFLISSAVCVICGYGSFIFARNIETSKKDWGIFINRKLPMVSMTIIFWGLALYSLYKFLFMMFVVY